jgi:hypothetical protein
VAATARRDARQKYKCACLGLGDHGVVLAPEGEVLAPARSIGGGRRAHRLVVMKKLVFLALIVALGIVAARRLRDVTGDAAVRG